MINLRMRLLPDIQRHLALCHMQKMEASQIYLRRNRETADFALQ